MPFRIATLFYFSLALAYSGFLFYIASYLPQWTKMAAAALTWAVYSRIVRLLVIYLSTFIFFITFIKWMFLHKKWLFLGILALYLMFLFYFVSRLGESVNEYVHFPEYAVLVLLWHVAFKKAPQIGLANVFRGRKTWIAAIVVSAVLGVMEECYQIILPQRVFDIQDILLNLMGVWLGSLLIWVFEGGSEKEIKRPVL
ncbi:MAG TPA: VanZ family protein [archaeon]|nr:VanZ family protein [archaeon]